jgi:hypothetical protein
MRDVVWIDKTGRKHVSTIRDTDDDSMAKRGIPKDPPNIDAILDNSKIKLHNALVERGLLSYNDVKAAQNALTNLVDGIIRHEILLAYKLREGGMDG